MTLYNIVRTADLDECLDTMVFFHRKYYNEPGYISNSSLIRERYKNLLDKIVSPGIYNRFKTGIISIVKDSPRNIFNIKYNNIDLKKSSISIEELSQAEIDCPDNITNEQIIMEVLFDYSFYNL